MLGKSQASELSHGNKKPPLTGVGASSALGLSEPTVQSFYHKISVVLGTSNANSVHLDSEQNESKMRELMGDRKAIFKLTIKPNGHISELALLKTSGSVIIDDKLDSVIRRAAPFAPNKFPDSLSWIVEFPQCNLRPYWMQTALPVSDTH